MHQSVASARKVGLSSCPLLSEHLPIDPELCRSAISTISQLLRSRSVDRVDAAVSCLKRYLTLERTLRREALRTGRAFPTLSEMTASLAKRENIKITSLEGELRIEDDKIISALVRERTTGRTLPVVEGSVVRMLGGEAIEEFRDLAVINGRLNGRVRFPSTRKHFLPVRNGEVQRVIEGEPIRDCHSVRASEDNFSATLGINKKVLPFVNDRLITTAGKLEISDCEDLQITDGKISFLFRPVQKLHSYQWDTGRTKLVSFLPLVDDKIVDRFGERLIFAARSLVLSQGKITAEVALGQYRWQPVILDQLIQSLPTGGEPCSVIQNCIDIHSPDGKLNGRVTFSDGNEERFHAVFAGGVVDRVDSVDFSDCHYAANLGGRLHGIFSSHQRDHLVLFGSVVV